MRTRDIANVPLNEIAFSVVDVETTGMHAHHNRIMDIGIVRIKEGKIVDTWESLIDPLQEVPYFITYYTRFTTDLVRGKPTFEQQSAEIFDRLKNAVFVGHNVNFDYSFVTSEFSRLQQSYYAPKLCTVLLGRKLLPFLRHANLDVISDYYNIKIDNRHRALPDALATAQILLNFIALAKDQYNITNFLDLYNLQYLKLPKTSLSPLTLFS